MLATPISSIDERALQALVANSVVESRSIEYKRNLRISNDSEKKEFLADVSSFANSSGGDIIFGIEEADGYPSELKGLESFSVDSEHLRIEEIIRNGLQPRIVGLEVHSVELQNRSHVLIIRIPQSIHGPHVVSFRGSSKFYSRNSAGKYMLDVTELRSAFLASEGLSQKIRSFRAERISKILNDETPRTLSRKNCFCIHLIPLEALNPTKVNEGVSQKENQDKLRPIYSSGWGAHPNFDGFLVSSETLKPTTSSYVQLFRNGVIEAVESSLLSPQGEPKQKRIPSIAYERELIEALEGYLNFYRDCGVSYPIVIGVSLLNVKGYQIISDPGIWNHYARPIDRDHLIIPEVMIEDRDADPKIVLKPIFDQIWNSCGWLRSINYDDEGNWRPRR